MEVMRKILKSLEIPPPKTFEAADANIQRLDRWKYDGTMPDYKIYFTPSDLGIYNIEAKIIDHTVIVL